MKMLASTVLVVALMLVGMPRVASANHCHGGHAKEPAKSETAEPVAQKNCPVMGNPINLKVFVDHEGRRIYFCCKMCTKAFAKDPAKYVKIVDEELEKDAEADKTQDKDASGAKNTEHAH